MNHHAGNIEFLWAMTFWGIVISLATVAIMAFVWLVGYVISTPEERRDYFHRCKANTIGKCKCGRFVIGRKDAGNGQACL